MKIKEHIFGVLIATAMLASCSKEIPSTTTPLEPDANGLVAVTFTAGSPSETPEEGDEDTKVSYVVATNQLTWDEGDQITITYSDKSFTATLNPESAGKTSGKFTAMVDSEYASQTPTGATYGSSIPTTQTFNADGFSKGAMPLSAGAPVDGKFTFNMQGALVRVPYSTSAASVQLKYRVGSSTTVNTITMDGISGSPSTLYFVVPANANKFSINGTVFTTTKTIAVGHRYGLTKVSGAVDMGLSAIWLDKNVGVTSSYPAGKYYAWGETTTKTQYSIDTYFDKKYTTYGDAAATLALQYDAAYAANSAWRMPTKAEFQNLIDNCTAKWSKTNGVHYLTYTSKTTGASIQFRAGGMIYSSSNPSNRDTGIYLHFANKPYGKNLSYQFQAYYQSTSSTPYAVEIISANRFYGLNIRPVLR